MKNGGELEGEDKIIGELMEQHPEYVEHWESTDFDYEYSPENDEVNPFLHIQFDLIVINQINMNDPKETKFTYNYLRARGDSHLEAIHKIAFYAADQIFNIMKNGVEFNEKIYVRNLKKLKRDN